MSILNCIQSVYDEDNCISDLEDTLNALSFPHQILINKIIKS